MRWAFPVRTRHRAQARESGEQHEHRKMLELLHAELMQGTRLVELLANWLFRIVGSSAESVGDVGLG